MKIRFGIEMILTWINPTNLQKMIIKIIQKQKKKYKQKQILSKRF